MSEEQVRALIRQEIIRVLGDVSNVPLEVQNALTIRLPSPINSSTKSATSENQAVDEGGSALYSVMKPPDAFAETSVGGTTVYIPYFT